MTNHPKNPIKYYYPTSEKSNNFLNQIIKQQLVLGICDFRMTLKKCSQFVSRKNLLSFPFKETPNMGSKQFDCPIKLLHSNFPESSMENPPFLSEWKFVLVCFCSISQLNILHFCWIDALFQSHMKVALSVNGGSFISGLSLKIN